jgi:Rrf2 family protein
MMLSNTIDYSILTLTLIASSEKPIGEEEISKITKIPQTELAEVIENLQNAELIGKPDGKSAGYKLTKNPGDITLWKILEKLDGAELELRGEEQNFSSENSRVHKLHSDLCANIKNVLSDVTLESLAG